MALTWPATVLREGDVVIDVGAHCGAYARDFVHYVGPTGYVCAVEPVRASYDELVHRAAGIPQIRPVWAAIRGQAGTATMYRDAEDARRSSLWAANRIEDGGMEIVPALTLDEVLETLPDVPTVIKMDAQGAEGEILRGAAQCLRAGPWWNVELWPTGLAAAGSSIDAVLEPFRASGYVPHLSGSREWEAIRRMVWNCRRPHQSVDVIFEPPMRRVMAETLAPVTAAIDG